MICDKTLQLLGLLPTNEPMPHASGLDCLQLGSTAIGIATSEGVVLAVEKRITSPLLVGTLAQRYASQQ